MLILYKVADMMRQIYVISLIILPFLSFSQLYIKPNGNKESFMYVQGTMVYVEKHIDLKKNPSGSLEASIYLRNEAQLLQGREDITNTGDGMLSVFQEGKATAYTYNYWGLPVRNPNVNSRSPANIIHEPFSRTHSRPAIITSNYNGNSNPLTISSRWIYKLSGWGYLDWKFIGNEFDLKPGEGFTMKGVDGVNTQVRLYGVENNPGGEQRYDFRGAPNTGTISLDIVQDEVLLVGNPYPSALDLNLFLLENTNTTGIAYFWDSRPVASHYLQDYEGGYGAYSPALGTQGYVPPVFQKFNNTGETIENTGNTGEYYARRYAPIAQGFIVEGLQTGKVHFRNRYREFQKENPVFSEFKSMNENNAEIDIPFFRLNVTLGNKYTRQLLIAFHPASTTGVDRAMDAKNFSPLDTDVGFWNENQKYIIDVRPEKTDIPLEISAAEPVEIHFELAPGNHFEDEVFLWNAEDNIYYNLKNQQVSIPVNSGDLTGKYWITFSKRIDNTEEPVAVQNEYKIFQNNFYHRAEILSPFTSTPRIIELFDIGGRKIREIKGLENEFYYAIPTGNLTNGVYIIKIISDDGAIVSKKVIISNL